MNYCSIYTADIANGTGVRVSLFVSGCSHHCKGCFNSSTWPEDAGQVYSQETTQVLLEALSRPYIEGLSLLGGEPMEPQHQETIYGLVKTVKEKYPDKDIWLYSGYTYEQLTNENSPVYTVYTEDILKNCDVLVDGRFVIELKDVSLKFRGSSNQRLIDLNKTRDTGQITLLN